MKVKKKISEVFDIAVPDTAVVEVEDAPPVHCPEVDPGYKFFSETIKKLLLWMDGVGATTMILTGPTGCGKTSLFEQFCGRLGIGVYKVPCHGRLELQELIGGFRLVSSLNKEAPEVPVAPASKWESLLIAIKSLTGLGPKMIWVDGPVIMAMRESHARPVVCMMDEFNFLHPSVFGGLNGIMDSSQFTISETGETVRAGPGFRMALTGNAVDGGADSALYRGIQKTNIAGLDRPCGIRVEYNSTTEDAAILIAACPHLAKDIVNVMVQLSQDVRKAFIAGQMQTTISTRKLVQWGKVMQARPWKSGTPAEILDLMKKSLNFVLLDIRPPAEQQAIHTMIESLFRTAAAKP